MDKRQIFVTIIGFYLVMIGHVMAEKMEGRIEIDGAWEYKLGFTIKNIDFPSREADRFPCKIGDKSCSLDYQAIYFISPNYPKQLGLKGIGAKCITMFDIDIKGNVENPKIIACNPPGYFEEETLNSIMKAKYLPRILRGKPVETKGAIVLYTYKVERK